MDDSNISDIFARINKSTTLARLDWAIGSCFNLVGHKSRQKKQTPKIDVDYTETFLSAPYLIDINPRVFAIWEAVW